MKSNMTIPNLIPRSVLFGNPVKTMPQISPDGTKLAYLAPVDNVLNIWVKTIGKDDDKVVTEDKERGIIGYFWDHDNEHILYINDVGGNENWRLYSINIDTKSTKDFTPFEDVQVQITGYNKHFPGEMLISMNKENPQFHDVYHLNLINGELKLKAKNPGNIASWEVDTNLKIRGAMESDPSGGFNLLIRETEESEWKKIISWGLEDSSNSGLVSFSKDGKYIYLRDSRNVNTSQLTKMNLETGDTEVIISDPEYDVNSVMLNPDTYEVETVSFIKARKEEIVIDKKLQEDMDSISKLDKGDFFIYDRDYSDKTWLLGFTEDNGPVPFYAFDRENKKGTFLFYNKPDLKKYTLSEMESFSFKAQDGLLIHGYITFPPGCEKKNLPMVINVHGGPWYRDRWGYNPEAQWLANRGYICMQINFRGSTGYGKKFLNAGDREWGGKMHQDLLDGMQYAVDKGYADKDRVAIYGSSYGGYAALVGATFTPDIFKCAIDVVGPSSLITLIKTIPPYWSTFLSKYIKRIGNPDTEEEFLKSRSPLFKVDNIKIPILVAQGANDPRVKQSEAEQIVEAMKKKGIDYEYLLFEDEGHGFVKPENRIKFYATAEKFLAKHLGGRAED